MVEVKRFIKVVEPSPEAASIKQSGGNVWGSLHGRTGRFHRIVVGNLPYKPTRMGRLRRKSGKITQELPFVCCHESLDANVCEGRGISHGKQLDNHGSNIKCLCALVHSGASIKASTATMLVYRVLNYFLGISREYG